MKKKRQTASTLDETLRRLHRILQEPDVELACASARVLGRLGPEQPETFEALCAALKHPHPMVAGYSLDALKDHLGAPQTPLLLPLLDGPDLVRSKAVEALKRIGPPALPLIERASGGKTALGRQRAWVEIVGADRSPGSARAFLQDIADRPEPVLSQILDELSRRLKEADAGERKRLAEDFKKAFSETVRKKAERASAVVLRLLGETGEASVLPTLAGFLDAKKPVPLQQAALEGIGRLSPNLTPPQVKQVASRVLALLRAGTDRLLLRPALAWLRSVEVPVSLSGELTKLLKHPEISVRSFAVGALGKCGGSAALSGLVAVLRDPHRAVREQAVEALGGQPAALPILLKGLSGELPNELAWTTGRAVSLQAASAAPAQRKLIVGRFLQLLAGRDPASEVLIDPVRTAGAPEAVRELMARVRKLQRARAGEEEARRLLKLVLRLDAHHEEARYEQAVEALRRSAKEVVGARGRSSDPVLGLFAALWRGHGGARTVRELLLKRIRADRRLEAPDLYYLCFGLSEAQGEERRMGEEILNVMQKRFSKHPLTRSARSKWQIESKR
jgi:HEAT repeat protein